MFNETPCGLDRSDQLDSFCNSKRMGHEEFSEANVSDRVSDCKSQGKISVHFRKYFLESFINYA